MRILYDNELDSLTAGSIIASTEVGGFTTENLLDTRLSTKWMTSDATAQSVICSFAAPIKVNTVAILGHNITSACTVTIEANTANSFITPAISTTMTVYSGAMVYFYSAVQSYQYWRISFAGQGDLEIGRLMLGSYLTISPSSLLDFSVTKARADTVVYGRGRQKYSSPGVGWRQFRMSFPKSDNTMITSLNTFIDTVGQHTSFLFCNFDGLRGYPLVEPVYCSLSNNVSFNHNNRQSYSYQLGFEEDL